MRVLESALPSVRNEVANCDSSEDGGIGSGDPDCDPDGEPSGDPYGWRSVVVEICNGDVMEM